MKSVLVQSEYLSIDETLYSMRHQINFRYYNPNKPAKYSLLHKSLNDARFAFTYQVIPYCGRPEDGTGPYYLGSTVDYVKSLVNVMPRSSVKGRNVSMDRLYTSISTANWLLKNEITVVGTLVTNGIGLPDDLQNAKRRGEFESTMHWEKTEGDLSLCTYKAKSKSKGKKNVLVLSTMRPLMGITCDDGKQKAAIIKFYDFKKGGTDVMDQKISKYSCKLLTHRWTMIHFFFLMDTIRCNAIVLHAIKHKKPLRKFNSSDTGWELALSLVRPFMLQNQLLVWGKLRKIKLQFLFRKILASPLQDLLMVIPDTPKGSKDFPYVSLKSVVLTTKKERAT